MKTITIHKAKTNLSRLIEDVCRGEEVVIARGKKPVAKLVPIEPAPVERKPGWLKGKFKLGPEFFEPLPPEELDLVEIGGASSVGHPCADLVGHGRFGAL